MEIRKYIRLDRLKQAGHVIKKEPVEKSKKVKTVQQEGRRKKGRPRLRWIDEINYDATPSGIRNWGMVA